MNLILSEIIYVISDSFFLPSMAFTTMLGIFIGAVIYDGDLNVLVLDENGPEILITEPDQINDYFGDGMAQFRFAIELKDK